MASKAKKGTPAPTSKKPVVVRKDGQPTRAAKKVVNKAVHKALHDSAKEIVQVAIEETKAAGKFTANEYLAKLIGKPVEYTDDLDKALYLLISTGHSMQEIGAMEGMPPLHQMLRWLSEETHPFSLTRARAKEALVPLYEELGHKIGTSSNPLVLRTRKQVVTKDGDIVWVTEKREIDNVERSKLAVNTLQWTLSHLKPKKHGRTPDLSGDKPNEQLEGLFAALKAGPKE